MSGLRFSLVLVAIGGLGLTSIVWAGERGAFDARGVRTPTVAASPPEAPRLPLDQAPVATLAPLLPTPSYSYVWDPQNPYQCFNPSDPQLPADAPRCPPRAVPPPATPVIVCASGYVAVVIDGQVRCAKKAG